MIAWLMILLDVAFIITAQHWPEIRGRKRQVQDNGMQLDYMGKYAVGVKAILPQAATQPAFGQKLDEELRPFSKTPGDAIRVAALAGEFEGAKAAIRHLDQIATTQPALQRDVASMRSIYKASPGSVGAEQRQDLIDHYGFFGKLALSFHLRESNRLRAEVLEAGKRVVFVLIGYLGLMSLLIFAGLILLTVAIVFRAVGNMPSRFEPPVMANTAYVEAFAIYLASFTLLPIPLFKFLKIENWILWSWPMIALLPVAMWWAHYRGNSWRDVRRAFGWHGGSGWWIEAPLGVAGYIAGLPVMLVGFLMTWVLIKMAGASPTHPIVNEVHGSAVHILGIYLLACVWAPVFEESMFRGALFAHLRRRWGWAMSAFPVALIFAAIHPQGWTTIPLLGSVALVLAAIREWRGSIIASIVCHACVNFGSVTLLVLLTR